MLGPLTRAVGLRSYSMTGAHFKQDLRYRQKPAYFGIFTNNIYLVLFAMVMIPRNSTVAVCFTSQAFRLYQARRGRQCRDFKMSVSVEALTCLPSTTKGTPGAFDEKGSTTVVAPGTLRCSVRG